MNFQEARETFLADRPMHESRGAHFPAAIAYLPPAWRKDYRLAMDAQPTLTTDPNSAIPALLTTLIDPQVYKVLYAAQKAAVIFGEQKKGSWTDQTALFPTSENTGEVTSYGDFNENGRASANVNWPNRQSYLFQTMIEYGELETERAGLGRLNWVAELQESAATVLSRFQNLTYFKGVSGLLNFGLLNDPNLSAALTPAVKAYGGTAWIVNGQIKATANEVYNDLVALFYQLVLQSDGLIEATDKMTLALPPTSAVALTATNSFGIDVKGLLKQNYPNWRIEVAVQYGVVTAANAQGNLGGNLVQLIVDAVEGQQTGYCAFNEKMRSHKLIPATSSYKQKQTSGTWGAIIRQPFGIAQMIGV